MNVSVRSQLRAVNGIAREVHRIIETFAGPYLRPMLTPAEMAEIANAASAKITEDFLALVEKDPAAKERLREAFGDNYDTLGEADSFLRSVYPSMEAVLWYRVSSEIYNCDLVEDAPLRRQIALQVLYPEGIRRTHIDIDPSVSIGRRFVLDHGVGTVIGRHVRIGDDCYILHCVNLGSGAAKRPGAIIDESASRHPTIGNRVKIFGYASVLGPVTVGDDSEIGTRCLVTESLPPNSKVRIINQIQHETSSRVNGHGRLYLFGAAPHSPGQVHISGRNFREPRGVSVTDPSNLPLPGISVSVVQWSSTLLVLQFTIDPEGPLVDWAERDRDQLKRELMAASLQVDFGNGSVLRISQAQGIRLAIEWLMNAEVFE